MHNLGITVTEEMIEKEARKRGELKLLKRISRFILHVLRKEHKDLYKCKIILHLISNPGKK